MGIKETKGERRKSIGLPLSTYLVLKKMSFDQEKPIAHIIRDLIVIK